MTKDENLAWCAGFFEGEGTIIYGDSHTGPFRIKVSSTDLDVLELLKTRSGVGFVHGPYPPKGFGVKEYWTWTCNGKLAVEFMLTIQPMLGTRRSSRLDEKISSWQSRPKRKVKITLAIRKDILIQRSQGKIYKEIAEQYGVATSRIFQICTKSTPSDLYAFNLLLNTKQL